MQRRIATGLLVGLMALAGAGCGQAPSSSGSEGARTAVVDLNAVAKALNRDEAIQQRLQSATQQLNQKLVQAAQQMQSQLQEQQEQLGEDASEEELNELKQRFIRARRNVQVNKAKAQLVQRQAKAKLVQQFRAEVQPIAQRIAQRQGADVVVVANQDVLWFDSSSDITDEVIAEMRAAGHTGSSSDSGDASQQSSGDGASSSSSGSGGNTQSSEQGSGSGGSDDGQSSGGNGGQ